MEGVFWTFAACVVALGICVFSFDAGRSSVANNCDSYGKTVIKKVVYVCNKP